MVEMLQQVWYWVFHHPRTVAGFVGLYLLLAALGWWGSVPPPLGSLGTDTAQPLWSLSSLPAPGGSRETLARLLAHPPWPQVATPESKLKPEPHGPLTLRRGARVGTWSLVGIVNPASGVSRALFLSPDNRLHRALPGATLSGKARLVSVGVDFILVHLHGQNRLRQLYAPVLPAAASTSVIPPSPRSPKPGS